MAQNKSKRRKKRMMGPVRRLRTLMSSISDLSMPPTFFVSRHHHHGRRRLLCWLRRRPRCGYDLHGGDQFHFHKGIFSFLLGVFIIPDASTVPGRHPSLPLSPLLLTSNRTCNALRTVIQIQLSSSNPFGRHFKCFSARCSVYVSIVILMRV